LPEFESTSWPVLLLNPKYSFGLATHVYASITVPAAVSAPVVDMHKPVMAFLYCA